MVEIEIGKNLRDVIVFGITYISICLVVFMSIKVIKHWSDEDNCK